LNGNVEGRDLGSVINAISTRLAALKVPPSCRIVLGGTYESEQDSFHQLLLISALGIILVYLVLVIQFRSFVQPLCIFTAIPISISGAAFALWITKTTLNVSSIMGLILLVGLVVKNGIILIDCCNRLIAGGEDTETALLLAGQLRLRPILMTTLCTILGLLPLAFGLGAGSELQKPLAIAVIGGLSVSTLATLLIMPQFFRLFCKTKHLEPASNPVAMHSP
jgi:multidrug efflux pump subunit AcrB